MRVIGYTRVSTAEQANSGLGLEAQRSTIADAADRRGWDVEFIADEGLSGKQMNPGLHHAMDLLRTKQAGALVVTKMDRLARSVLNASDILETAKAQGWSLIVLDLGMDLSTPSGKAMAQMLAVFAELEREMIGNRTKEALAVRKAKGLPNGRPSSCPPGTRRRIVLARNAGGSFRQIAAELSAEGILTPTGRRNWQESTVRRIYNAAMEVAG